MAGPIEIPVRVTFNPIKITVAGLDGSDDEPATRAFTEALTRLGNEAPLTVNFPQPTFEMNINPGFQEPHLEMNLNGPGVIYHDERAPEYNWRQAMGEHLDRLAASVYGLTRLGPHTEEVMVSPETGQRFRAVPAETDEQLRARMAYVAAGPPLTARREGSYAAARIHADIRSEMIERDSQALAEVYRRGLHPGESIDAPPAPWVDYTQPWRVISDGDRMDATTLNLALGWPAFRDGDPITAQSMNEALGGAYFTDAEVISADRINRAIHERRLRSMSMHDAVRAAERQSYPLMTATYDPSSVEVSIGGVKVPMQKINYPRVNDPPKPKKTAWCRLLDEDLDLAE